MKVQTTGRSLLHAIFRQRKVILGLALGILGTILLGTLLWPPSYEAFSSVIIRGRNYQNLLFPEARRGSESMVFLKPQEEINSEIEIIRSRPVLARVVESLSLHARGEAKQPWPWGTVRGWIRARLKPLKNLLVRVGLRREFSGQDRFEAAVTRLSAQLRVEPATDSQIIRIIYRDRDPVMAAKVVNKIAEEYLRQHLAINLNRAESSFYEEHVKKVDEELVALQRQLEKTKSGEGIVSFSEQSKALLEKLKTFDVALATTQKEIISRRSKVERIKTLLKSDTEVLIPLPEIAQNPIIEDLETKLVALRFTLETLRQRYTADSQQVQTTQEQVRQVEAQIRRQVNLFLDREVAEMQKLQAEERALAQTVRRLKDEIKTLPAKEQALAYLEKQIEDKQASLTVLRNKYQDSLTAQATDFRLENAKIVSQASVPLRAVSPNLPLNLALGLILAVVVSFSTAFFLEYWDDSLKVPEDVERSLGLPVFASIPEL